jgi:hypothetical protein
VWGAMRVCVGRGGGAVACLRLPFLVGSSAACPRLSGAGSQAAALQQLQEHPVSIAAEQWAALGGRLVRLEAQLEVRYALLTVWKSACLPVCLCPGLLYGK